MGGENWRGTRGGEAGRDVIYEGIIMKRELG